MSDSSRSDDRLRVLEAITDSTLGHLGLNKLLQTVLEQVRDLMAVDTATVLLYDPHAQQLSATAAAGLEEEVFQGVTVPFGTGFAGRVAAGQQPVVLDRVDDTTVVNPLLWERGLRVLLGVPMLVRDELIGVLHIGSLTPREFFESDIQLLQRVADRLALATQLEVTTAERAAAAALQRSLLPARLPTVGDLEFAARYVPGAGRQVGGDWYDVFKLPEGRMGIVIGDVAGNGLGAAVIMGRLRSALRAYTLEHDDPAEVLGRLDRKAHHFEQNKMATVCYAVVDAEQKRLRLSLAGHLPPALATVPGQPAVLVSAPVDPPIGMGIGVHSRRSTAVDLPVDSVLAFYTDGLVERRDRSLDCGLQRLTEALVPGAPEAVCAHLMATMVGADPVLDDVALLVARRHA
jgi:sigma-B regulation protein RsbU (phosphoserine phosphatase)